MVVADFPEKIGYSGIDDTYRNSTPAAVTGWIEEPSYTGLFKLY
jgi:hypothetical protein